MPLYKPRKQIYFHGFEPESNLVLLAVKKYRTRWSTSSTDSPVDRAVFSGWNHSKLRGIIMCTGGFNPATHFKTWVHSMRRIMYLKKFTCLKPLFLETFPLSTLMQIPDVLSLSETRFCMKEVRFMDTDACTKSKHKQLAAHTAVMLFEL